MSGTPACHRTVPGTSSAGFKCRRHACCVTLQVEIAEALIALEDAMREAVPDNEQRLMLTSAVYPAYDLAWQMEDLLMDEPDLDKLASCVALQRVRGNQPCPNVGLCVLRRESWGRG